MDAHIFSAETVVTVAISASISFPSHLSQPYIMAIVVITATKWRRAGCLPELFKDFEKKKKNTGWIFTKHKKKLQEKKKRIGNEPSRKSYVCVCDLH